MSSSSVSSIAVLTMIQTAAVAVAKLKPGQHAHM